jgi:hypothetical protein
MKAAGTSSMLIVFGGDDFAFPHPTVCEATRQAAMTAMMFRTVHRLAISDLLG